jgi:hypothetical protein
MRVAIVVALALPVRAWAQMPPAESSSSREAELRPLIDVAQVTPGASFTTFAQAVAEVERSGDASHGQTEWALGAELAARGDGCRIAAIGGQGRAIKENLTQNASAEEWSRLCFGGGFPVPQLELSQRYEWQVRPSLYAARSVLARPYTRQVVDGLMTFIDLPPEDELTVRLQLGLFGFGWEQVTQHDAGLDAGYQMFGGEAIAARLLAPRQGPVARTDATVDILAMGGWFTQPENPVAMQTMLVSFIPVRVRALRLGDPHLLMDGEVALVGGGFVPPAAPPELPRLADPPAGIGTVTGNVTIYGGGEKHIAGIGYARTLRPTTDGLMLLEDRGTAWLTLHTIADYQYLEATLSLFAAHTSAQAAYGESSGNTYGGGLNLGWLLARTMKLGFDAEVARSFYARLDSDDPTPLPALGFRVIWSFSTLFGSRS